MDPSRKHQVSLRGASAKEISREALLEKVSQERELRNYARRATAAAIFIQSVWRCYYMKKKVAIQLLDEWETLVNSHASVLTATWISSSLLRPFLFFITCLSTQHQKISPRHTECMQSCFKILLESINCNGCALKGWKGHERLFMRRGWRSGFFFPNVKQAVDNGERIRFWEDIWMDDAAICWLFPRLYSVDSRKNFCSLAVGTLEERITWTYQAKKLISLCSFILSECDKSHSGNQCIVILTSIALRLVVVLTDVKGWKSISNDTLQEADMAVKDLVWFMGSCHSGLYISIRRYFDKLSVPSSSQINNIIQKDDRFLITASAVTLAVRPFHLIDYSVVSPGPVDVHFAAEQYCLFLLTIPWLLQRLPAVFIPALKHKSIMSPCFQVLLILRDNIFKEMQEMGQLQKHLSSEEIPPVGWALANIMCLATGSENDFVNSVDYASYVQVVITLAENLLTWFDSVGWIKNEIQDLQGNIETSAASIGAVLHGSETFCGSSKMTFMDLFRPVCQRWHLVKLLEIAKTDASFHGTETLPMKGSKYILGLCLFLTCYLLHLDILWIYGDNLKIPFFPGNGHFTEDNYVSTSRSSGNKKDGVLERKQKQINKDASNKFVNALHKLTGKSQTGVNYTDNVDGRPKTVQVDEESSDVWDVKPLKHGPPGISKDMSCLLHLFCATYSHLLLVLDDIEFYEKQVPFTLEQQRRIASMLNTLVYNGLNQSIGHQNRPLMDSAIRCLHLMYERDCRHRFCPPVLWLSPAKESRLPIAVAARTHEILSANTRSDDVSTVSSMGSVITTTPHVFPFEERVEMFREFINMDKVSRKMAGEVTGPGSRSIEIVVRRGHIVEDGFRQLNSLGSRLKSSIHVSFVSECGLPEAGLDYGGLSKEFLTDISKSAFAPEYGLFSQTSTSDRLLVPNAAARYLENGIRMFEFLGRVVGKALYEGILLDYSFSHVFVQKLLGRYSFLDELSTLDPELYRNLMYVKHYEGDIKELCLDFTVTEESFGKHHVIPLKPGGKDTSVTNENKMQYVHAMADYKLNRQILPFSNAFYRGLTDLIQPSWLKLFNASEFNQLLSGGKHDIDVDDLRNNTRYTGGYSEGSRTVKLFWEVIEGFEPKERCMLLKFVTSCSRAPLLGFKHLQPSFTIHKVACDSSLWAAIGGQDVERLPSASTCYNTLKLPTYKRSSTLRTKLLYAINSNAGFELS
ncbi:hypothetical protein Patl1_32315 [Pistacia atlantica]|uniref:Uncharacterized protein n=1 Tax=Pistacia atlantica TaxID=434234 RepID=A0ACC1AMI6_9ROSI|nr:hypothetical protein Patl1_32315 [Pistacia atlantica]